MSSQRVDAAAIRAAVDLFYSRLLADPAVSPMWEGVDMPRLRAHQRALLAQALGGPALYAGRDMKTAHAHLGITGDQFERMLEHLVASLREVGVARDVIERATVDLGAYRPLVVTA